MNYSEAVKWYREAADQGFEWSYYRLGNCYHSGFGVEIDDSEAIKWLKKAADAGIEEAKESLDALTTMDTLNKTIDEINNFLENLTFN